MKSNVYYWLKLQVNFFDNETIDFILNQDNGSNYIIILMMLMLKSINHSGKLISVINEVEVPYTKEKIQRECKYFCIETITKALELFLTVGILKNIDGIYTLSFVNDLVGKETEYARIKRKYRIQKKCNN